MTDYHFSDTTTNSDAFGNLDPRDHIALPALNAIEQVFEQIARENGHDGDPLLVETGLALYRADSRAEYAIDLGCAIRDHLERGGGGIAALSRLATARFCDGFSEKQLLFLRLAAERMGRAEVAGLDVSRLKQVSYIRDDASRRNAIRRAQHLAEAHRRSSAVPALRRQSRRALPL